MMPLNANDASRPVTTTWPLVVDMKNFMSAGRDQTKSLSLPMTPLEATAAMVLMRMEGLDGAEIDRALRVIAPKLKAGAENAIAEKSVAPRYRVAGNDFEPFFAQRLGDDRRDAPVVFDQ